MYRWSTKPPEKISNESGMTLVITLFLLLSLLMMASGITFVANNFANLSDGVTNKSFAIDGAETCTDKAFEWLSTDNGKTWLTTGSDKDIAGVGEDLYQYTVFTDTTKNSDKINLCLIYSKYALWPQFYYLELRVFNEILF